MNKDTTNTFGVPVATKSSQTVVPGPISEPGTIIPPKPRKRSVFVRLLLILLSVILLVPGCFFFYVAYLALSESGVQAIIIPTLLGLIFIGGGISGIISNVRS